MQVICNLMMVDFRIVELRSVPTANTIIGAKITLDFKMIDGRAIPLKERNKTGLEYLKRFTLKFLIKEHAPLVIFNYSFTLLALKIFYPCSFILSC